MNPHLPCKFHAFFNLYNVLINFSEYTEKTEIYIFENHVQYVISNSIGNVFGKFQQYRERKNKNHNYIYTYNGKVQHKFTNKQKMNINDLRHYTKILKGKKYANNKQTQN